MAFSDSRQHAGQPHGARPARRGELSFGAGFAHPSPQNSSVVWGEKTLRRVVGGAVIEHAVLAVYRCFSVSYSPVVQKTLFFGRIEQAVMAADQEEVRALPHLAAVAGIGSDLAVRLSLR